MRGSERVIEFGRILDYGMAILRDELAKNNEGHVDLMGG